MNDNKFNKKIIIPKEKILEYLLSPTHLDGRHKAAYFERYGFSSDEWEQLGKSLIKHASMNTICKEESSPFGKRYVIEGTIETPTNINPYVRTVWFESLDEDTIRLVTAYPIKRKK